MVIFNSRVFLNFNCVLCVWYALNKAGRHHNFFHTTCTSSWRRYRCDVRQNPWKSVCVLCASSATLKLVVSINFVVFIYDLYVRFSVIMINLSLTLSPLFCVEHIILLQLIVSVKATEIYFLVLRIRRP